MIRKSGYRFSEKIMLQVKGGVNWNIETINPTCVI
jgi:hypothetical protein